MTEKIKRLRERSGAGIGDVKRALDKCGGDEGRAFDLLRKEGKKIALKKADRVTHEGIIGNYVHANGKVAALVSVACETDFVARNETFRDFAHDLALHVTAMHPTYLSKNDIPAEELERETEILREQAAVEGKPKEVAERIVAGRLEKFFSECCLLHQPFVKDDSRTIQELLEDVTAKLGEKIEIKHFIRFTLST